MSLALVPVILVAGASAASAAGFTDQGGGAALPWDGALTVLTNALTGNVARLISIIAIFVAGVALIFGEDLGHFAKRMLMIVIAVAFLVGASTFFASISTGAHI
jgi:type IV secretion system protein VirB2